MLYRDLGRIIQTPSQFMNLWKHPHSLENISPTLISKIQTRDEGSVGIHTFDIWNLKFKNLFLSISLPLFHSKNQQSWTFSHKQSFSISHAYNLALSLSNTHTLFLSLTQTIHLSHKHTFFLSLILSLSLTKTIHLSLSLTHTLFLSLTHTI